MHQLVFKIKEKIQSSNEQAIALENPAPIDGEHRSTVAVSHS
jgi:uncharacterized protein YccT (UPF0319 family)